MVRASAGKEVGLDGGKEPDPGQAAVTVQWIVIHDSVTNGDRG